MLGALDTVDTIDKQSKLVMMGFFKQAAARLVQKVATPKQPKASPTAVISTSGSMTMPSSYASLPPPLHSSMPPSQSISGYASIDATPPYGPMSGSNNIDKELNGAALILKLASTGPVSDYLRPSATSAEQNLLGAKLLESHSLSLRGESPARKAFSACNFSV
jgi:hypothetical protein